MSTSTAISSTRGHRLDWTSVRTLMNDHFLKRSEIPIEHHVSLPLPTLRHGEAAFAFYACATIREPHTPSRCQPPDRHWAFAAHSRALLFYARSSILPLAPARERWSEVTIEPAAGSVKALVEQLNALGPIMDQASAAFFDGTAYSFGPEVADEFVKTVGRSMMPFYRAAAPDFFAWLTGNTRGEP